MKIAWYHGKELCRTLRIEGKRLDAAAPPLRAKIHDDYGDTGFQPSEVIFSH